MKTGWQMKRLGEVCQTSFGGTPLKSKKEFYEGGAIPWLMSGEVSKGEVLHATNFITQKGLENSSAKIFPRNTVLVAMYGATAGEVGILRFESSTNQAVCGVLPNERLIPEFLFYCLLSKKDELIAQAAGNAQPNISQIKIRNTEIPVPPLPEQQRIVAILDEAFAAIAKAKSNAEQNLKNAKELFESYLQNVFENKGEDWEEKTLEQVCEISSKLIDPRKSEFQKLVHIGAGNIESRTGNLIDLKTAEEENLISGKFLFDEKMILYSKIRPYLIKVVRCAFNGLCSADIYPLVPLKNEMIRDFLYYLLLTKNFTDYAILGSQRAGMPKVNREHLFAYRSLIPSLSEQQTIVQKLDALSTQTKQLEAIYQQKLTALDELKKSILNQAISGQLS
ncbi:MAG: restriction endonuclease subunit S [Methylobacter sp.]|nr:restriction endonuclease subunit S [Methylobacter sp.]